MPDRISASQKTGRRPSRGRAFERRRSVNFVNFRPRPSAFTPATRVRRATLHKSPKRRYAARILPFEGAA